MVGRVGRGALVVVVAALLPTVLSVPAAHATTKQSTVLPPADGTVRSSPDEPHHTPYGGDYSFDVATTGAAYARFRNTNGALSLTVAAIRRACRSGLFADGGDRIVLNVLIDGAKVGTVTYAHLTRFPYTSGDVPVGAKIGDIVTNADGVVSSDCWTGPHVHIEPRNDVRFGCYFPGLLNTWVTSGIPLGLIGGEKATRINQPCPPSAEPGGSPPFGHYDSVFSADPGRVHVAGWAIDDDARTSPVTIHVYVGGEAGQPGAEGHDVGPANVSRPDVGAAFPGAGDAHGFDVAFDTGKVGGQPVCVYAIDIGGPANTFLGCKSVTIADPNPFGHFDESSGVPGGVRVVGWSADRNAPMTPTAIHVYIGGAAGQPGAEGHDIGLANLSRPDVGAAFPGFGDNHGFNRVVATANRGTQTVCAYGINIGPGSNALIGCGSATIAERIATSLTISRSPTLLTYGRSTKLTGKLTTSAGAPLRARVALYQRPKGSEAWSRIGRYTTATDGRVVVTHKPRSSRDYQFRYGGAVSYAPSSSRAALVRVRPAVSLAVADTTLVLGQTAVFSGSVAPRHAGQKIDLQRYSGGEWRNVKSRLLSSTSTYRISYRPTSRTDFLWRVYRPADVDHAAGASRAVRVYVR